MTDDESSPASAPPQPAGLRRVGKPFAPGNRANPGGRPKTTALVKAVIRKQSPRSLRALITLANDPNTSRELSASVHRWFVEQDIGKATTRVAGANGQPLFPMGSPANDSDPLTALLARMAAQRDASRAGGQRTTPAPASAPQGANGVEPRGVS